MGRWLPWNKKNKKKIYWNNYRFLRSLGRTHKQAKRGAGQMIRDRHFKDRLAKGRRF